MAQDREPVHQIFAEQLPNGGMRVVLSDGSEHINRPDGRQIQTREPYHRRERGSSILTGRTERNFTLKSFNPFKK